MKQTESEAGVCLKDPCPYHPANPDLHPPDVAQEKETYLRGSESKALPRCSSGHLFLFFNPSLPPAELLLPINRTVCIYPPGGIAARTRARAIQSIEGRWSKAGKEAAERFPRGEMQNTGERQQLL